ncbi:response regulator transcription factor [Gracilibacillus thailandensis]|jgi:two-component system, OmpR family, response regulator ResD|uniref:Response regulator n=1 Tax=Gracilibacillus thailandensis TaxID=563735 RepID=A0A6N7QYB1_9BACI|nr:response regulator transcription factor [Gracilibacillus thailandensis]MRI67153.1 response regulator [Gracilibacillus thailandensis]
MKTILIVDDEQQMRSMLTLYLRKNFKLIEAKNGNEAIDTLKHNEVDLVLLDIMMPELDGIEACKQMKKLKSDVPIILLTALNETSQKVEGLTIGADDYVVKPFEPEELLARIHVQLRHFQKEEVQTKIIHFKELKIDPVSHTVTVNGKDVKYSPKEFDLLYLMAAHPNRVYTREQLLDLIWGLDEVVDIRTVDSHVRYVRDKLKKAGISDQPIETVWGVGYKFNREDHDET